LRCSLLISDYEPLVAQNTTVCHSLTFQSNFVVSSQIGSHSPSVRIAISADLSPALSPALFKHIAVLSLAKTRFTPLQMFDQTMA
jgi:hypothetical protein